MQKRIVITIVALIVLVFGIYKLYKFVTDYQNPVIISEPKSGKNYLTVSADSLPLSERGVEYTYSFWLFVNDWDYNYDLEKNILFRGTNPNIFF